MEQFTFEASDHAERITCISSFVFTILLAFAIYFIQRQPTIVAPFRHMVLLLGSFLIVLSFGVGIFSLWQWSRLGQVAVTDASFMVAGDSISLQNITSYRIESESSGHGLMSIDNGQQDIFLAIQTMDQKSYILMESNYDIYAIRDKLDTLIKARK